MIILPQSNVLRIQFNPVKKPGTDAHTDLQDPLSSNLGQPPKFPVKRFSVDFEQKKIVFFFKFLFFYYLEVTIFGNFPAVSMQRNCAAGLGYFRFG